MSSKTKTEAFMKNSYDDMPNGYQVTQDDQSIGTGGFLDVEMEDGNRIRVHIDNLHMDNFLINI